MNEKLDELRSRLRSRYSEDEDILNTTFRRTATPEVKKPIEATKAKEPKPMSTRSTKNHTGQENWTIEQVTSKLDSANTQADRAVCVMELQNRFSKFPDTLGRSILEAYRQREAEYKKGFSYHFDPEPEPESEPIYEPPPPPSYPPLTRIIIQEMELDLHPYMPYINEIHASDWDYKDRRINHTLMRGDQDFARGWVVSRLHDDPNATAVSNLSEPQWKFMLVLLKAYLFHKENPRYQANDPTPPF